MRKQAWPSPTPGAGAGGSKGGRATPAAGHSRGTLPGIGNNSFSGGSGGGEQHLQQQHQQRMGRSKSAAAGGGSNAGDDGDWSLRVTKTAVGIPEYDASRDPNCPLNRTEKFQRRRTRMERLTEADRSPIRSASAVGMMRSDRNSLAASAPALTGPNSPSPSPSPIRRTKRSGPPTAAGPVAVMSGTLSTASGGITFQQRQTMESTNPAMELDVLKAVLLREGYISRLRVLLSRGPVTTVSGEVIDLLDLLRLATVETAEAIVRWRKAVMKPVPFMWNGLNYLLKMGCDLNFLDAVPALRDWLGFSILHNPLLVPVKLSDIEPAGAVTTPRSAMSTMTPGQSLTAPTSAFHPVEDSGFAATAGSRFTEIGNKSMNMSTPLASSRQSASGRLKHPYVTPVVNNDAAARVPTRGHGATTAGTASNASIMPSHIGDLDMIRVREAERIINAEESLHGRFIMDGTGRLIPEVRPLDTDATRRRQLQGEPQRRTSAGGEGGRWATRVHDATHASDVPASVGAADQHSGDIPSDQLASSYMSDASMEPPPTYAPIEGAPQGWHRALKKGGELVPLTRQATAGQQAPPTVLQSRGARVDMDIARARSETQRLADELARLREELALEETRMADESQRFEATGGVSTDTLPQPGEPAKPEEVRATALDDKRKAVRAQEAALAKHESLVQRKEDHREAVRQAQRDRVMQARNDAIADMRATGAAVAETPLEGDDVNGVSASFRSEFGVTQAEPKDKRPMPVEMEESEAATHIQRIARGRAARRAVEDRRRRYNKAATKIQSVGRGRRSRLRVKKMRRQNQAALEIQRQARGMIGRRYVNEKRAKRNMMLAATLMQAVVRGRAGRRRVQARRQLFKATENVVHAADLVTIRALADLAALDTVSPAVLTILHCSLLLIAPVETLLIAAPEDGELDLQVVARAAGGDTVSKAGGRDGTVVLSHILSLKHSQRVVNALLPASLADQQRMVASMTLPWSTVQNLINQNGFITRIKRMTAAAEQRKLIIPQPRIEAVNACFLDPNVNQSACQRLPRGVSAASALLQWVQSISEVGTLLPQFQPTDLIAAAVKETIEAEHREAMQDSADMEASKKALAKRGKRRADDVAAQRVRMYVPEQVLGDAVLRPRPMVLMVARDVPTHAAKNIVAALLANLPGVFVSLGKDTMDVAAVQAVLNAGRSAIIRVDIGMAAATRRSFLARAATLKNSLNPTPQFILVRGAPGNRRGGGHTALLGVGPQDRQAMGKEDAMLKGYLETAADCVYAIRNGSRAQEDLLALAVQPLPTKDAVLTMEALIVLLSPGHKFSGPNPATAGASWQVSHRLLLNIDDLATKMEDVDPNQVPPHNLVALEAYLRHDDWPKPGALVGGSRLAVRLAEWVQALTRYAALLTEQGGVAPAINKAAGIFSALIVVRDGIIRGDVGDWEMVPSTEVAPVHPQQKLQVLADIERGNVPIEPLPEQSDAEKLATAGESLGRQTKYDIPHESSYEAARQREATALGMSLTPTIKVSRKLVAIANDGGWDGEGGWKDAYEDVLRAVLRDMKVYGAGKRLGPVYTMVSVYRDCRRLFIGTYDPATSTNRFVATRDDLFHVNDLLAPNSLEQGTALPKPQMPADVYSRLVDMLRYVREPMSGRRVLHLQRARVRLLRETRKIDSVYMTLTAFEETAGTVVFEAYIPANSRTLTLTVSETEIADLAYSTPTPAERKALQSGDIYRIGRALADRLQFKRRRGAALGTLSLRSTGEAGRIVCRFARRLGGVVRIVTVHEAVDDNTAIVIYTPSSQATCVFRLTAIERNLLFGMFNTGMRAVYSQAATTRIRARPRLVYVAPLRLPKSVTDELGPEEATPEVPGLEGPVVEVDPYLPVAPRGLVSNPQMVLMLDRSLYRVCRQIDRIFVKVTAELSSGGELMLHVEVDQTCAEYELTLTEFNAASELAKRTPQIKWPPAPGRDVKQAVTYLAGRLKWANPRSRPAPLTEQEPDGWSSDLSDSEAEDDIVEARSVSDTKTLEQAKSSMRQHPQVVAAIAVVRETRAWLLAAKKAVQEAKYVESQSAPMGKWLRCGKTAVPPSAPRHFRSIIQARREEADMWALRFRKAKRAYAAAKAEALAEELTRIRELLDKAEAEQDRAIKFEIDKAEAERAAAAALRQKDEDELLAAAVAGDIPASEGVLPASLASVVGPTAPVTKDEDAGWEEPEREEDAPAAAAAAEPTPVADGEELLVAMEESEPTDEPEKPYESLVAAAVAAGATEDVSNEEVGTQLVRLARRIPRAHRDARGNLPKVFVPGSVDVDIMELSAAQREAMLTHGGDDAPHMLVSVLTLVRGSVVVGLRIQVYDAKLSALESVDLPFVGKVLVQVLGDARHLIEPDRLQELADYVANQRIALGPADASPTYAERAAQIEAVRRQMDDDARLAAAMPNTAESVVKVLAGERQTPPELPSFSVLLHRDTLFERDKVTPLFAAGEADLAEQKARDILIHDPAGVRGIKLFSIGRTVDGVQFLITVFDVSQGGPCKIRFLCYQPSNSRKHQLIVPQHMVIPVLAEATSVADVDAAAAVLDTSVSSRRAVATALTDMLTILWATRNAAVTKKGNLRMGLRHGDAVFVAEGEPLVYASAEQRSKADEMRAGTSFTTLNIYRSALKSGNHMYQASVDVCTDAENAAIRPWVRITVYDPESAVRSEMPVYDDELYNTLASAAFKCRYHVGERNLYDMERPDMLWLLRSTNKLDIGVRRILLREWCAHVIVHLPEKPAVEGMVQGSQARAASFWLSISIPRLKLLKHWHRQDQERAVLHRVGFLAIRKAMAEVFLEGAKLRARKMEAHRIAQYQALTTLTKMGAWAMDNTPWWQHQRQRKAARYFLHARVAEGQVVQRAIRARRAFAARQWLEAQVARVRGIVAKRYHAHEFLVQVAGAPEQTGSHLARQLAAKEWLIRAAKVARQQGEASGYLLVAGRKALFTRQVLLQEVAHAQALQQLALPVRAGRARAFLGYAAAGARATDTRRYAIKFGQSINGTMCFVQVWGGLHGGEVYVQAADVRTGIVMATTIPNRRVAKCTTLAQIAAKVRPWLRRQDNRLFVA